MYRVQAKFLQNVIINGVLYGANSENIVVLKEGECEVFENAQLLNILSKTKIENTKPIVEEKPKQESIVLPNTVKTKTTTTKTTTRNKRTN